MKKSFSLFLLGILTISTNYAQNLGINTSIANPPTNTLDVNGTLRVRGGSPGVGKVLTSDANGVGTWTASSASYPRITYDAIVALPTPALGDMAYDITFRCLRVYNGSKWIPTYRSADDNTPEISLLATQGDPTSCSVYSRSITTDASGNVYIAGFYQNTATFGSTTITTAGGNTGYYDIFLAKYSSNGTLAWVQSAGGSVHDEARSIAVDAAGNVYITGYYTGTATFGSITKTSVSASKDIFVAKYNSSGTALWVQSTGGSGDDSGNSIVVDASGNTSVTGYFSVTATFGATNKTSAGGTDIFVSKYNTSGSITLVQSAGGTSEDEATSIVTDASGNIYITGSYQGTATFGAISKTTVGNEDIFIAKYDPVGAVWSWVQSAGGSFADYGYSIAIDNAGYLCITGEYVGSCTFGTTTLTSAGNYDGYIVKYYPSGNVYFAKNLPATSNNNGRAVTFDATGNIYVTGIFSGLITLGPFVKASAGNSDIFIAKYDSNGNVLWGQAIPTSANFNTSARSIKIDASNNIYITGSFSETATFGNTTKVVPTGIVDSYIALIK